MNAPQQPEWRIGVDEAGYGPNLGPLVVAATAWLAPPGADLYDALAAAVTPTRSALDSRLHIADSKAVYQSGAGLAALEGAVLAACDTPANWSGLVDHLGADPASARADLPWHEGFDPVLPIDAPSEAVAASRAGLHAACQQAGVTPPRIAARLVFPAEFNRLAAQHGTKGAALSHVSLGVARHLCDTVASPGDCCRFTFDKHGGRNRYGALLQEHFPEGWVETLNESRPISHYRAGENLSFAFRTKGEEELPVALASMTAKLLRELSMKAFNAYWCEAVPDLRPTAGYPVDAKRFRQQIAAEQKERRIRDESLWRDR